MAEIDTHKLIREQLAIRMTDLERKKAARQGTPGFAANVNEIDKAIEALDAEIQSRDERIAELEGDNA